MPIKQVGVELGWGPAKLSGIWEPGAAERDAAPALSDATHEVLAALELGTGTR